MTYPSVQNNTQTASRKACFRRQNMWNKVNAREAREDICKSLVSVPKVNFEVMIDRRSYIHSLKELSHGLYILKSLA